MHQAGTGESRDLPGTQAEASCGSSAARFRAFASAHFTADLPWFDAST